jgi:hypothetical protein
VVVCAVSSGSEGDGDSTIELLAPFFDWHDERQGLWDGACGHCWHSGRRCSATQSSEEKSTEARSTQYDSSVVDQVGVNMNLRRRSSFGTVPGAGKIP